MVLSYPVCRTLLGQRWETNADATRGKDSTSLTQSHSTNYSVRPPTTSRRRCRPRGSAEKSREALPPAAPGLVEEGRPETDGKVTDALCWPVGASGRSRRGSGAPGAEGGRSLRGREESPERVRAEPLRGRRSRRPGGVLRGRPGPQWARRSRGGTGRP